MTLDEYFHTIIKQQPVKETTMFDIFKTTTEALKAKWTELMTTRYEFKEEPANLMADDYWAFEMYTGEWYSDDRDELIPVKHTCIIEPQDGTWMEVLDMVIDEMEKHYGYSIKEQVYYSVVYPNNVPCVYTEGELPAGYGRSLNDTVLQQLLLAYPEVYNSFVDKDYTITGGAK